MNLHFEILSFAVPLGTNFKSYPFLFFQFASRVCIYIYIFLYLGTAEVNKGRVRMRHNRRKSSPFPFHNAGGRFSVPFAVWACVSLILFIYFLSLITEKNTGKVIHVHPNHLSVTHELEEIEQEPDFRLPTAHKRNPRAVKRRGSKKHPTAISEFLDESSEIHSMLFPHKSLSVGLGAGNDSGSSETGYFHPGQLWLDTDGNPIQAHGGGILFDVRGETYYWYGENKDGATYHSHPKGTARVSLSFFALFVSTTS